MAERHARFAGKGAGFQKRILHPCYLLLHGAQRFADHRRTHTLGAQLTQLSQLKKIKEGIRLSNRNETGFFPSYQLLGSDSEDPQNIRSLILLHERADTVAVFGADPRTYCACAWT